MIAATFTDGDGNIADEDHYVDFKLSRGDYDSASGTLGYADIPLFNCSESKRQEVI